MTSAAAIAAAFVVGARPLRAQSVTPDRGAAALGSTLAGIGTTGRVLTVAAHPDDEDTPVIAWLAKGRHVETAYLSLTRGDGGQNLIGNELGEALGAIRTQELLSARRIDGGRQYFTRAYDFGFSKKIKEVQSLASQSASVAAETGTLFWMAPELLTAEVHIVTILMLLSLLIALHSY